METHSTREETVFEHIKVWQQGGQQNKSCSNNKCKKIRLLMATSVIVTDSGEVSELSSPERRLGLH